MNLVLSLLVKTTDKDAGYYIRPVAGKPDATRWEVSNRIDKALYANLTQEEAKIIAGLANILGDADWGTLQPYIDELLPGKVLALEWIIRFCIALELRIGGGEGEVFVLRLGLGFITIYISLECYAWQKKLHLPYESHNTGFYFVREPGKPFGDFYGHLEVWQSEMEWKRGDWSWHYDFDRIIWGSKRYVKGNGHPIPVIIPMPEKGYAATVTIQADRWLQPRKFWKPVMAVTRATVTIPEGIPHPGKGTESYNQGDDALLEQTFPCSTVEEAIRHTQESAQWYRDNYPM